MSPIPVFMYHHVNLHKGDIITVTPDIFDAQMQFLKEAGYRTLNVDELVEIAYGNLEIKEKAVAVTFDDGYLDNYVYAFPVLKKYNIKATIFIVTDWVEKSSEFVIAKGFSPEAISVGKIASPLARNDKMLPNHNECKRLINEGKISEVIMNWDMLREMKDSELVSFYSHTKTHRKCAELSNAELMKELQDSKRITEQRLNETCLYLCWPKGSYKQDSVEAAKEAGYKALFTTKRGVVKKGSDIFSIERIAVKDNVGWFKNRARIYTNPLLSKLYLSMRGNG